MSEKLRKTAENNSAENGKKKDSARAREFISSAVVLLAVFVLFFFIIGIVPVEGASMQPLINPVENESETCHVVIFRPSAVSCGDVVVMKKPDAPEVNLIKRVIALPGQTVKVYRHAENREVAVMEVDGAILEEGYIPEEMAWSQWEFTGNGNGRTHIFSNYRKQVDENEWIIEFTVPEGFFFALGDNRNHSRDSRHYGFFKLDSVLGRTFAIFDEKGVRFI